MTLNVTNLVRHGAGPHKAIVMNGWLGCAQDWISAFDAVDPSTCELAVFEYRGYGTRRDVPGDYTFDEAAQDVLTMADQLGWSQFGLIGHSMSGMAMQAVALTAPERINGLMGVAPVSAAGSALSGDRLALFEQATQNDEARQKIVNFSTGGRLSATWCAQIAQAAGRAHLPQAMQAYLLQWGQGDIVEAARGLRMPIQLLVGQHDPSINLSSVASTWQHHHPHAKVHEIAGVGHYPMLEAPAVVGTAIEQWLTQVKA